MFTRIKTYGIILLVFFAGILMTADNSIWAKQDAGLDLNLTDDQLKALEVVIDDLNQKQFKVASDIERTLLELKLELQREDRFATEAKATEAAKNVNKLVKKLTGLYGEMLKLEVAYVLKAKDVLTKEQRTKLIEGRDFEMESSFSGLLHLSGGGDRVQDQTTLQQRLASEEDDSARSVRMFSAET